MVKKNPEHAYPYPYPYIHGWRFHGANKSEIRMEKKTPAGNPWQLNTKGVRIEEGHLRGVRFTARNRIAFEGY